MSIRIVTHAYAKILPQYATFLRAHLSSLVVHPPLVKTAITICCTDDDERIMKVLDYFLSLRKLELDVLKMEKNQLLRRAIGRNKVALELKEELIWFADVDYYFGPDCVDSVWNAWQEFDQKPVLIWPKSAMIQRDHEIGDQWHRDNFNREGLIINTHGNDFKKTRYDRAIGGVQISPNWYVRKHGYMNDTKWLETEETDRFFTTVEDVHYRRSAEERGLSVAIDVPNLFRFRHSESAWAPKTQKYPA